MRWILAVGALTLVALTSPIAAGDKRSAALAVRVTVVRACSVNTDAMTPGGGAVTCGTRFGPPVLSANSTIVVPLPAPPSARVDAEAFTPSRPAAPRGADPAPSADAAGTSARDAEPIASASGRGRGAGPGQSDARRGQPPRMVAYRLITVNF